MKTLLRSVLVVVALSSTAFAQQSTSSQQGASGAQGPSGPSRGGAPRTPPPEAVAACSGKSAGASCTFQHKDRTETGTCFTPDASQAIACKPVRPPRDEATTSTR
ncbi:MAG: hypothetical protein WCS72_15770 [Deltaproteobacteria bacterium]